MKELVWLIPVIVVLVAYPVHKMLLWKRRRANKMSEEARVKFNNFKRKLSDYHLNTGQRFYNALWKRVFQIPSMDIKNEYDKIDGTYTLTITRARSDEQILRVVIFRQIPLCQTNPACSDLYNKPVHMFFGPEKLQMLADGRERELQPLISYLCDYVKNYKVV